MVVMQLENPKENPCFGCGPGHARGLHLNFSREGDEVVCTYTPKPDEIGWPGLMHTGLHFTVLFEASYWAAWELTGKVHVAHGPQVFDQKRLPRVGRPFTVRAKLASPDVAGVQARRATEGSGVSGAPARNIVAVSATEDGKECARLESGWRTESRERVAKLGLPDYILRDMEP